MTPDLDEMGADGEFTVRYLISSRSYEAPCPRVDATRTLTQVSGRMQPADQFASMLEEMGGTLSKDAFGVMTLTISSDSLCEFFGGATLFEWGVMTSGTSVVAKGTMLFSAEEDTPEPAPAFADVPAVEYYAKPVAWAVQSGITNGDGGETVFSPDRVCSCGQIVTFLHRAYVEEARLTAQ